MTGQKILYGSFIFTVMAYCSCNSINDTLKKPALPTVDSSYTINKNGSKTNAAGQPVFDSDDAEEKSPELLYDRSALEAAEKALRALPEFKGKDIYVYSNINIYDNIIYIKIQNPTNPDFVDSYKYNGVSWELPTPVRLSSNNNVARDIINLNDIPLVYFNNVYNVLTEKYKEIGSKPTFTIRIFAYIYDKKIRWSPNSIESPRYEYRIEYNPDGTLLSFKKQ